MDTKIFRSTPFLVLLGSGALAGLSGCSSDSGDSSNVGGGNGGGDDGADDGTGDGTPTGDDGGDGTGDGGGDGTPTGDDGDTGTDDGDDDGGAFVGEPDIPDVALCDPWLQDCPEGEKCIAYDSDGNGAVDANRCQPVVENPKSPGDPCTGTSPDNDDCDETSYCGNNGDQVCIAFCTGSPQDPQCEPGFICAIDNDGVLISCTEQCDPLLQDCASDNAICMEATGMLGFNCVGSWDQPTQIGEACIYINACAKGLACVYNVPGCADACCSPYCNTSGDWSECDALPTPGAECIPWFDQPVPGYENVGVCVVPP
jgi:hypothetical protein